MAIGTLRVRGSIAVDQFWPMSTSDADTTKVKVLLSANGFEFEPTPGAGFTRTRAFDNAVVASSTGRIPPVKDNQITVRLQGVDAPELHYRPPAEKKKADQTASQRAKYLQLNEDYRQPLSEAATLALAGKVGSAGQVVNCVVTSRVDAPNEVFDVYGRFVGDITVRPGTTTALNLNQWLLEYGWGMPSFYSSMSEDEITTLTTLANEAYYANRGVWPSYEDSITQSNFEFDRIYRRPGPATQPNPAADRGKVINPKLFRRMAAYAVNKKAGMVTSAFLPYLRTKTADTVHRVDEFLAQGPSASPVYHLADLFGPNQVLEPWPEEVVFREKPSRLLGPGGVTPRW
jgi:endonuclease YncB( thermonuclease family)